MYIKRLGRLFEVILTKTYHINRPTITSQTSDGSPAKRRIVLENLL